MDKIKSLAESILDDPDEIFDKAGKRFFNDWITDNVKGDYRFMVLKSGGVKIWGTAVIKNFQEARFDPQFKIVFLDGSLTIEKCPNLESIEGLFDDMVTVKHDFSINNCPKLTSLVGGPWWVSDIFQCVGNKSLRSLDGAPTGAGDVYIMKNGKKFKETVVRAHINVYDKVNCSQDDGEYVLTEENINEALNEPHLLKIADQLKKYGNVEKPGVDFRKLFAFGDKFAGYGVGERIKWDEVDSSHVTETRPDAKAITLARNLMSERTRGIILLMDKDGEYTAVIQKHRRVQLPTSKTVEINKSAEWWNRISYKSEEIPVSQLIDEIKRAERIVFITGYDATEEDMYTYDKMSKRSDSRKGMVLQGDDSYYRQVARENRKRYEKLLAERKVLKQNSELTKIDDEVNDILNRFMKLTKMTHTDPKKFANKTYEIGKISQSISSRPSVHSYDTGLLYYYETMCTTFPKIVNKETDYIKMYQRDLDEAKENVKKLIVKIDTDLKNLGV